MTIKQNQRPDKDKLKSLSRQQLKKQKVEQRLFEKDYFGFLFKSLPDQIRYLNRNYKH